MININYDVKATVECRDFNEFNKDTDRRITLPQTI